MCTNVNCTVFCWANKEATLILRVSCVHGTAQSEKNIEQLHAVLKRKLSAGNKKRNIVYVIRPTESFFTVCTLKTRDNENICQSFGQTWPVLLSRHVELLLLSQTKATDGAFDNT